MPDWIVVADASKAVIYTQEKPRGELEELTNLVHPQARVKESDLVTDAPSIPTKTSARETEDKRFARDIVAKLRNAVDTNEIRGFYLSAPPQFLGLVRDAMDDHVRRHLRGDIGKKLTNLPVADVQKAFAAFPTIRD
ncbi:host attachment protein [Marinobacterium lutimaris]|uniref:Protein required for attachment to host cells n=1 Tax=Marinobacterium lutimaris TaxID=568106 RepID=A0A1H6DNE0_9GAMM|nr:host attachment protein [Marinobacterium lutimaris]SEG86216.1 Protein required for attachment to host cells [Marinobacterium lutimaris]